VTSADDTLHMSRLSRVCFRQTSIQTPKSALNIGVFSWKKIETSIYGYRTIINTAILVYKCLHSTWVCITCIPYWRALSDGRCRGSSATPFQFIFIIDCQLHPTPHRRWPSFLGRRHCTCLEQSAWSCHFHTFRSSLPVPALNSPV